MLVIVLWQAPLGPGIGPDGRISLLFGGGIEEIATLNCAGDVLEARSTSYRIAAVEVDGSITQRWRIAGAGGFVATGEGWQDGMFGLAQLRADGSHIGVGGGVGTAPTQHGSVALPSAYLRVGPGENLHLRADLFAPSALLTQQAFRVGIGYNATRRDVGSGFLGVALLGGALLEMEDGGIGVAGELTLPIRDRFGMRLSGHYGMGHRLSIAGLAVGDSYTLH